MLDGHIYCVQIPHTTFDLDGVHLCTVFAIGNAFLL